MIAVVIDLCSKAVANLHLKTPNQLSRKTGPYIPQENMQEVLFKFRQFS